MRQVRTQTRVRDLHSSIERMASGTSFISVEPWPEADACAFRVLSSSWVIEVSRLNAT